MVAEIVIFNSTEEALEIGYKQGLSKKQEIASSVIHEAFWVILVIKRIRKDLGNLEGGMKSQRETRNGLPEIGEKVILSTK